MKQLKATLLDGLGLIDGVEHRASPVSGGSALFYRGKEFAHFHHDHELDLRLTAKLIKAQGLSQPPDSIFHPKRSVNSPWIEIKYENVDDVVALTQLVKLAIAQL